MPSDTHIDPQKFPRTAAYIEGLGNDLDPHANCTAHASLFADLQKDYPELLNEASLSDPLRARISAPWESMTWLPEGHGVMLYLMVRDAVHQSDEQLFEWNFTRLYKVFESPFYRALMFVMSPTLVFMGASSRWKTVHKGSILVSRGAKKGGEGTLAFPANLFSEAFLVSLNSAYAAGLTAAGAKNIEVELTDVTSTEAHWRGRWD